MKKRRNDPTNLSAICRERGVDPRLVEQRMRIKMMTLEEAITTPVRGRKVRDWLMFRKVKHRMIIANGKKGFSCSICGGMFRSLDEARQHAERHNISDTHRRFICRGCGTDWMTVLPDVDTCQRCYSVGQQDIEDWIKHDGGSHAVRYAMG